ncbi:signal peptidase I [Candidatus Nomurabacteria bacterium]|nr:signal peptidase I [Candidatus Nomurabacteria bacterium]
MENKQEENKKQTGWQNFWELLRFALIAIAIVIPIRIFIAQPFVVSGSSMFPTFHDGQYLIVDEISFYLNNPKRDDVVIFRYPNDTKKFFIKRVIGLPNETVNISGNEVTIINKEHPEGFKLDQPFVENKSNDDIHAELGNDEYFVMGDNRTGSYDSRAWGPVPRHLMIGRAFLRLLPINKINILPGKYNQNE